MKTKTSDVFSKTEKLSKAQMKQIMASLEEDPGDCGDAGAYCNTPTKINCCNGLVCAENNCWRPA